eukprot:787813-Rhodomonas_salina.4
MSWTQRRSSLVPVAEQHHEHTHHHAQAGHAPTIAPGFLLRVGGNDRGEMFEMYVIPLDQVELKAHPKPAAPEPEKREELPQV